MTRWIASPQEVVRGQAMPDMGLSARDARAIAAYLETLK
jgi:cytochrome c2